MNDILSKQHHNNMVFLKEDGSIDIKSIKKLPLEKRLKIVAQLTEVQFLQYLSTLPITEGTQMPIKAIEVEYDFNDERSGIDAFEFINRMRDKYEKNTTKQSDI